MTGRLSRGATAYAKDGRRYTVEEVAGGVVYCIADGGAETEFPESQLMSEAEWNARSGNRRETIYNKLKQARDYAYKGPLDRAECEQFLAKADRLFPGLLDFAAFTVASRILTETGDQALVAELSIIKCRAVFDGAPPQARATILAGIVGAAPDKIVGGARLGDNLARAMIEKGLNAAAFEAFGSRRRQ
ncbi:MAG TPA: hypothetical protein VH722_10460 [Alphaproteobacteria bacterium]|nr:hypothetical protein [Alphaproteobacteria bacterium]